MDLNLKGKKVIVLGGTRGIGRGIAEAFAVEGAAVAICGRNRQNLDDTLALLRSHGGTVTGDTLDITDSNALRSWIEGVAAELGGIDVLVSNAGAMVYSNDEADWKANFQVDLLSGGVLAFEAAKQFLIDSAAASGDAAFIMIASVSAGQTYGAESYGPIKAALVHYAKGLARQYAAQHVRVNAISPSSVYFEGSMWQKMHVETPEKFEQALARNPMGRMASVQDIANAAIFLASPVSSFTTGINMVVDGAITMRVNL